MASPPNPVAGTAFGAQVHRADRGVYGFRGKRARRSSSTHERESAASRVAARKKVVFRGVFGEITLCEFDGIDVDGAAVIEGSPSIGMVSSIAAKHLVHTLELPLCGALLSPQFPPGCTVSRGVPSSPLRIYGDRRLVVFVSEFRLPIALQNAFVDALLDFASRHHARMVYALEGKPDNKMVTTDGAEIDLSNCLVPPHLRGAPMPLGPFGLLEAGSPGSSPDESRWRRGSERKHSRSRRRAGTTSESSDSGAESGSGSDDGTTDLVQVHFVTTSLVAAVALSACNAEPMLDGAIDGVTGAIMAKVALHEGLDATALLVKANTVLPDARAAATVVTLLSVLETDVPEDSHTELHDDANELEQRLTRTAKSAPPPPSLMGMYV
eukprot:Amastigsp_a841123_491.p1 type:complete len:382 gc:universal Amastigsp_a841123_491:155-1300(+)